MISHDMTHCEYFAFQIHGFSGDRRTLKEYFKRFDMQLHESEETVKAAFPGSVLSFHPGLPLLNEYPGHDITDPVDFENSGAADGMLPDWENLALPWYLARLQPENEPCILFYNRFVQQGEGHEFYGKMFLIHHGVVREMPLFTLLDDPFHNRSLTQIWY